LNAEAATVAVQPVAVLQPMTRRQLQSSLGVQGFIVEFIVLAGDEDPASSKKNFRALQIPLQVERALSLLRHLKRSW
jgi:hypothetical protein